MKISQAVELKGLQSQIEKEKNKLKLLEKEKIDISNQANECKQKINNINQKIKQLQDSNKDIIVSEHALLRYIERVIGIDLKDIEDNILNEADKENIKSLGNCKYPKDGFKLIVKNNVVTTIVTKGDE